MGVGRDKRVAFGAPAESACDVHPSRNLVASRQDEAPELVEVFVEAVAVRLETVDLLLCDAQPTLVPERHRQVGTEIEELVLYAVQYGADGLGARCREHEPECGVELVDGPVGTDPLVALGHARTVAERGVPRVAAACVDLREPDRLVSL